VDNFAGRANLTVPVGVTLRPRPREGHGAQRIWLNLSTEGLWRTVDNFPLYSLTLRLQIVVFYVIAYIDESQSIPPYMGVCFLMYVPKKGQIARLFHIYLQLSTVIRVLSTVFENLCHSRRKAYPPYIAIE